jgi:uncharacterized protein YhaN
MRLLRLELLRYGHLSDVVLEFPAGPALHLVLGANEAGKSTALEAIGDALFGIPERSERAFQHPGPQLGIGFTLAAADGASTAFTRRKGRGDTLRDAAGRAVPDAVLRPFLGRVDRALFERSFGLDGTRLRQGADDLLRSDGELGAGLLAGVGVPGVNAALARLEEQARALHGDGRGKRRLAAALDVCRKAQQAVSQAIVGSTEWKQAEGKREEATRALERARQEARDLSIENSRLERLRRVRPILAQLDPLREELAGIADAPDLPADAALKLRDMRESARAAQSDEEREASEARRLRAEQDGLVQDPAVLAEDATIDALAARRAIVAKEMLDLSGVQSKVGSLLASVAEAGRELGTEDAPETLCERVPTDAARRRAQRLITERATLVTQERAARDALAKAQRRRETAAASLGAAAPPPSSLPLRRAIEAARGEGPLERDLLRVEAALARASGEAAIALEALPLWSGDAAALAACAVPIEAEVQEVAQRLAEAKAALAGTRADAAALAAEIATLEEEVTHLARGETVPTRDVIAEARAARDRAWRLIRQALAGGATPDAEAGPDMPQDALPETFEALRDRSDRLADLRADDAQRVVDYATKAARRDLLRERLPQTAAALATAEQGWSAAEHTWHALWAPAGLAPQGPAAMAEWRREREEVLRRARIEAEARAARDDLVVRRDVARAALAAFLPDLAHARTLADLLAAAEVALEKAEQLEESHRDLVKALAQEDNRLPELNADLRGVADRLAALRPDWARAAASLAAPPDADAETLEAALAAWARIAEAAPAWRGDAQRVREMQASIQDFARSAREVLGRLFEPPSDEPATVLVANLASRLAAARKARDDAESLIGRIATLVEKAAQAKRKRDSAEADMAALRALAGVSDAEALDEAVARSERRARLAAELADLERSLLVQGDGLTEEVVRAEAMRIDSDAANARLDEIERDRDALNSRLADLGRGLAEADALLAALRHGRDAAAHAQAAEDALAEARAAAEEYARLHLARTLLRAGIERFRQERQDPLLCRAGAHFAAVTAGRYVRLLAVPQDKGKVVLHAVRDHGTECPMHALSEGTRDQLFLALRVAAVESHAAHAEPMPFIADDLLVHFDDTRAEAGLALLAELGRTTQVILFTHHEHLAALARRKAGVAVQTLPHLPATGAMPEEARSAA